MKLTGNTILITGGGTGIGAALAKQFAGLGNQIIICGRREEKLKQVADECPQICWFPCDIASESDRKKLFEFITTRFPKTNVLINNAAVQTDYNLLDCEDVKNRADEEIYINLNAPIQMNAQFIPHLLQQEDPVIINVTSILGFMPLKRIPVYCAAKAGFHVYSLVLREQLADTPITVYEAPPCKVETDINPAGRAKTTDGTVGIMPDEYAAYVIEKLGQGQLDIIYEDAGGIALRTVPRTQSEIMRF